ncbi:MAG: hypothetical protein ACOYMA_02735 [Bacteroidia bacterium]
MRKILVFCILLMTSKTAILFAQDTTLYAYSDNDKKIFYTSLQAVFIGNQPISYFAWMPEFYPIERPIKLQSEEGKYGYLFEANFDQNYTLFQGRSNANYFWQTTKLSFKYAPLLRLTFDMNNYLLPTNQKVGGQLEKVLWDNHTNYKIYKKNLETIDEKSLRNSTKPIKMVYLSLTGMHYSNGLIFQKNFSDSAKTRNNYQKGYFSTNYFQAIFYYSYLQQKLLTIGLGYQLDVSGMNDQMNRYGQNRILLILQSRSKPRTAYFNLVPRLRTIKETDNNTGKTYVLKRLWEHRFRFESEFIAGNLDNFKRSQDYRFGMHLYYEILPLRSRSVGAMIHTYYGRDYLNIRYDDVVFGVMGGLTISFNKYINPRFSAKNYIVNQ